MGNKQNKKTSRKRKFTGNRHTNQSDSKSCKISTDFSTTTASESKLINCVKPSDVKENEEKNIIFSFSILEDVISSLCCPQCFQTGLCIVQESVFGLAVNMTIKCKNCHYYNSFCTSKKVNKMHNINLSFVFGMRVIGKGHSAAQKLCSSMNVNTPSKKAFGYLEKKLELAANSVALNTMKEAASEIRCSNEISECSVSVDGTWQRRGYSSLNGCVTAISIDTGKLLDIEFLSKVCRLCNKRNNDSYHNCEKHSGSSGAMEPVGAYRIFERSVETRKLRYVNFFGDGDSKAYAAVKDIYGKDSVKKYECIGHIQKRVGSRLRKLKQKQKGLGGRGKLTDMFIDKLQNYYGIAIRDNVNDLRGMQRAVIAAFFHCCSSSDKPMHGQCPDGSDSWCKYQRAISNGTTYKDKSKGLPKPVINIIKPVYMQLCDQTLLEKCLPGKTQNCNESFNGILWKFIPKDVFVELSTLRLGGYMAVIQFNSGFHGLLDILKQLGVIPGDFTVKGFAELDQDRVSESKRHSQPNVKITRKKNRLAKKKKLTKHEQTEGITYKSGDF